MPEFIRKMPWEERRGILDALDNGEMEQAEKLLEYLEKRSFDSLSKAMLGAKITLYYCK